jgi:hypothetical protein
MKVYFGKSEDFIFYTADMEKYTFNFDSGMRGVLLDYLREQFKSIHFVETEYKDNIKDYISHSIISFCFDDPPDEAFFLLWSSPGVIDINFDQRFILQN